VERRSGTRVVRAMPVCYIQTLCRVVLGGSLIDERTQVWRSVSASRRADFFYGSYIRKNS
jgi:hypothetical protein